MQVKNRFVNQFEQTSFQPLVLRFVLLNMLLNFSDEHTVVIF